MSLPIAPSGTREVKPPVPSNPLLSLTQYVGEDVMRDSKQKIAAYRAIVEKCNAPGAGYGKLCAELQTRQQNMLRKTGWRVLEPLVLPTRGGLVCGMSSPTPLEVGMTLFRPHGVPYIPDSTVKGVIASWLGQVLTGQAFPSERESERVLHEAGLLELFRLPNGKEGTPENGVIFFDALPRSFSLALDVTTPHHAGWYQNGGERAPDGVENPVPVYFLTVAPLSQFVFRFALHRDRPAPSVPEALQKRLDVFSIPVADTFSSWWQSVVRSAADYKGFGAQTGGGYGHFGSVTAP